MMLHILKSKLYKACVTKTGQAQEGSCQVDADLLSQAGLVEYEQVEIFNIDNGERFTTYVVSAAPGSRTVVLNGAAARKAQVGDRLIIAAFAEMDEREARNFRPALVYLNRDNRVERVKNAEPRQVA